MTRPIVLGFAGVAALAAFAPLAGMAGEMATALGPHVAVVLAALGGWALYRRRKIDVAAAVVALAMLLVTCGRVPDRGTPAEGALEVVVVNAYEYNATPSDEIAAALAGADVVLLIEPRPGLVADLEDKFSTHARHVEDTKFDLVALVRDPTLVETSTVHRFEGAQSVVGEVVVAGQSLVFVHVPAPTADWQQAERVLLEPALTELIRTRGRPTIVVGDFNAVPTSPLLSSIAEGAGLELFTSSPTWPVSLGPLGVAIDHVLATSDARLSAPEPYDLPGSDHRGWRFSLPRRGT